MIGQRVADWVGLLFVATVIYVLVRPSSRAAELVGAIGDMVTALVRRATDLGGAAAGVGRAPSASTVQKEKGIR